jgi:hypothetical protein
VLVLVSHVGVVQSEVPIVLVACKAAAQLYQPCSRRGRTWGQTYCMICSIVSFIISELSPVRKRQFSIVVFGNLL